MESYCIESAFEYTVYSPLFSRNWTPAQNGRLDRVGGGDRAYVLRARFVEK